MFQHAMDKIRDEMAGKEKNPGIQFLGGWLTGKLTQHPEIAASILDKQKTIEGALGEIRKYAEEHRTGNFAFVPPETALDIVGKYYGIETAEEEPQAPAPAKPERRAEPDDLDLDALLGGL